MKSERWQEVERIYHAALERDAEQRAAFIAKACDGDEKLLREVESLLSYEQQAEDFIESPALQVAAKMMAGKQGPSVVTGQLINQYKIISQLGTGGMGEVYLAEDTRLQRKVALKFLPVHFTEDERYLQRFKQEARTVAGLSHPNVCMVHEVIETGDGSHFIVMEYVEGTNLRERIVRQPMKVVDALEIAIQVASALSAAHAAGIVHRDIKLENIMLRSDGYVKVLDFGLAKLSEPPSSEIDSDAPTKVLVNTMPGIVMGTVAYMSPEQARGLPVDARTDIWSLGVVLYELVAGKQPFTGATATDVIISIAEREPVPLSRSVPGLPVQLDRIVKKTLAKNRDDRYQTAADLLIDLKTLKRELEIEAEVGPYKESTTSGGTREIAISGATTTSRYFPFELTRGRVLMLTALVGMLIVGGVFSAQYFRRKTGAPPVTGIRSLAVLPMANISGDPTQDYFADGMTETIIAGLAKVGALRVISRSAVMQYKGSQKPLPEIAHDLNVDAIVQGTVQRVGDQIQMRVQLNPAQGDQLWSAAYDRDIRDILLLQNEITQAVTQTVRIKLTPQEETRLAQARQMNPAAYDYVLRGRFYLNRQNEVDNATAIQMFEKAVATDPNFAAAQAELAQAYVWRLFLFAPDDKQLEEKAYVAAGKALEMDPESAEAHLARGRLLWTPSNHFRHEAAIKDYRRALGLNPSLDEARNQLSIVYLHVGLLDEARQEAEQALAINPSNALARFRICEVLLFQNKYEQGLAALRDLAPQVNPALIGHHIVWALFKLGRNGEAASTLEQFSKDYPQNTGGLFTSMEAVLAAASGETQKAEEKIKLALERGKGYGHFHHTAYDIACAYALMKRPEEAMKWLEIAASEGFPCYPLYEHDSNLDNLRGDSRFLEFMSKLKSQWEHYKSLA